MAISQRRRWWASAAVLVVFAAAAAVAATDSGESRQDPIVVHGTVIDGSGKPVAGAKVWLVLRLGVAGNEARVAAGESDEHGRYRIEAPAEWAVDDSSYHPGALWCYSPGHSLGVGNARRQVKDGLADPVALRLGPESKVAIKVLDADGKPAAGAPLTSFHYLNGGFQPPPQALFDLLSLAADEQGKVALPFADPAYLYSVQFTLPEFGDQSLRLSQRAEESANYRFRFMPTGAVKVTLEGGRPEDRVGVRLYLWGEDGTGVLHATANAELITDEGGVATGEPIAAGRYRVHCRATHLDAVRPRLPQNIIVRAGETTMATVNLEPTIEVRGRVVAEGSDQPVDGATVSVRHGNGQNESAKTDGRGWYAAQVLPGPVYSYLSGIPKEFQDWSRVPADNQPTEAADSDQPTSLPDLVLRETVEVAGRLVDQDNRPLAKVRVMAVVGNRTQGGAVTDASGEFKLSLPKDEQVERYTAYAQEGNRGRHPVEIVAEEPLLLRINTSGVPTNVTITTSATPPDKLRPPAPPAADGGERPVIIVAQNVMIAGGKSVDLFGAQEYLESFENPAALMPELLLTQESLRGGNDRYQEMRLWADAMRQIIGFRNVITNILGSSASSRYDSLQLGDPWPPVGTREVAGRVVNAAGDPAQGAQVVLVEPPPTGARFYYHPLYLTDGSARQTEEEVITHTDQDGRFAHRTAAQEFGFIVMHPDGFAIAGTDAGKADGIPIALKPWARVTAKIAPDKAIQQHLSVSCRLSPGPGLSDVFVRMNSPRGELKHDFIAVPPGMKVSVQRNIEGASGISTSLTGASANVQTKPGETVHVEFGALTKTQRATAEAQLKEWGE